MKLRYLATGFTALVFATQFIAPAAAACHSRLLVCRAIAKCLTSGVENDVSRIKEGIRTNNGNMVWAGTSACKNNFGEKTGKEQFDENSGGCSDQEYVEIGIIASRGAAACD